MKFEALKVGELARRTGLTVRALHHYDAIGLLRPSLHTEAGHRLYTATDVARLAQVMSLRQLGFSLDEVRSCLSRSDFSPLAVVRMHLERLREQIECERKLCQRLERIAAHFQAAEEVSADEFLHTIEAMTMANQYFTDQQLELIERSRNEAGPAVLAQKQAEWAELIAAVRAEMDRGADPASAKVQALARRWTELVRYTTGGDAEMEKSLKRLWDEQGDALAAQFGAEYDPRPCFEYISRAIAASDAS